MDSLIALVLIVYVVAFVVVDEVRTQPKLQAEVDRKLEGATDKRVCSWCSKTGVPAHVNGVMLPGQNARDFTWYCSKQCYRTGHGAS